MGKDKLLWVVANTCYEINRQYCMGIGDTWYKTWLEAEDDTRISWVEKVMFVRDNPRATAKNVHDNWVKDKIRDGWVYGKEIDHIKKIHPYMINYHSLDKKQRTKDKIFREIVKSFY